MIDQCIYEVYKRDKKVFIPEFGAIIYSEFNDGVNFNALLDFDDGKVVTEIQKQQFTAEEDARKALEMYINNVKKTLDSGKSVFFGGLGYLSRDKDQNILIQKAKSSYLTKRTSKPPSDELSTTSEDLKSAAGNSTAAADGNSTTTLVRADPEDTNSSGIVEADGYFESADTVLDQQDYQWEETSGEDFAAPDDENDFSGNYIRENAETYPERSPLKTLISAVIPVVLLAAGGYYYFNYYASGEQSHQEDHVNIVDAASASGTDVVPASDNNAADLSGSATLEETSNSPSNQQDDIASLSADDPASDEYKTYSLILGSFKVERNADNYRQKLLSQGVEAMKFYGRNSFYFVGYEKIEGKTRAMQLLQEVRQGNPSAWIINQEMVNP